MANTKKPTNRKARQAAEAAAAKAKAEQEARDRRNQTIIGAVVVAIVVILVAVIGFNVWRANNPSANADDLNDAWAKVEKASPKPANATDKGGFILSKDGVNKPVDGVPTVGVYMDFMCPGCGSFERSMGDTFTQMVDAGQINLEIHPNGFMDRYSTDEYSTRTANATIELMENDNNPDHILKFISLMYAEDFQPSETSYKSVSDDDIKQQMIAAGVSEDVAAKAADNDYQYKDWVKAMADYTPLRSELWNTEGSLKGQMTTPTVTFNGKYWNRQGLDSSVDTRTAFLKAIGLDSAQVGQSGTLPEIGSDKGPLYP
ncbi:DsbA family protein [Bifidobacterium tissieri]|uniref:Disulfide bond formation protein DsbA n=1 Tax=Bifidobacterium tissieri TaxID=1630162 RepID=A0A5M9ZUI2_9BIFI|nr:thioredoxin domain-containing protein [Bifidobacterium tissieri]KAA8830088.1 disulfide bond formation protein DsbA [Bifidobacterium tissieri]KAA8831294.1 disulfide bond formation protein DsbA [Bifidobacterium tissieri]